MGGVQALGCVRVRVGVLVGVLVGVRVPGAPRAVSVLARVKGASHSHAAPA